MRWIYAGLIAATIGAVAQAQVFYPPSVSTSDVQQAITAATPSPCSTPLPDTLAGSPGTGPQCMPRSDATRPTVIQAKDTVTLADATWSVTWDRPFTSAPIYTDARVYGAAQPYLCTVTVATTTGASGKCYQLVATTLPVVSTALLGLVVSPFSAAGANFSIRVVARQ